MPRPALTTTCIVVPCYNESERLQVPAIERFLQETRQISFLFVNDGSRDQTPALLQSLAGSWPDRVHAWSLSRNCGKAEAVRRGILKAIDLEFHQIGFWDADLATPLDAIPEFTRVLERHAAVDVVWGTRQPLLGREIRRNPRRFLLGRIYSNLSAWACNVPVYDASCGAKLFRNSKVLRPLFDRPFHSRWIFDVEILSRLQRLSARQGNGSLRAALYELPVDRWDEVPGSKIRPGTFVTAFLELLQIGFRHYLGSEASLSPAVVEEPAALLEIPSIPWQPRLVA